jgi:fucose permease
MGLTGGVWMARVPAAKAQAHLSDGTLGIALFAVPVGLVLGAALAERLVDRVGSAILVRICGVGSCVVLAGPGLAGDLPELMAALFVVGVVSGTLDVSQNAQGVRVEAGYGRPVMTSMHACYSLGAIVGALAGGGFAWADVTLLPSLAAVGAAGVLIDGTAARWLLPETRSLASLAEPPALLAAGAPEVAPVAPPPSSSPLPPSSPGHPRETPRDAKRVRRLVLALGVLGICALVCEGAAGDWSAVYLRDNLGTSAGFAAVGFAAFSGTMTLGRGFGDRLIRRHGVVPVIRVGGVTATAGIAAAVATRIPAVAVVGFAAFGAGLSIVVPQVFAAGGRADPARPGSGLAKVVGLGYAGMAAGPAVIGLVAGRIGLRLALAILIAGAFWIAIAAGVLTPRGEAVNGNAGHGTVGDDDSQTPVADRASGGIPLPHGRSRDPGANQRPDRNGARSSQPTRGWQAQLGTGAGASSFSGRGAGPVLGPAPSAAGEAGVRGEPGGCRGAPLDRGRGLPAVSRPRSGALHPGPAGEVGSATDKRAKEHRAYREVRQGRWGRLRRR